jgi:hypothetical protein
MTPFTKKVFLAITKAAEAGKETTFGKIAADMGLNPATSSRAVASSVREIDGFCCEVGLPRLCCFVVDKHGMQPDIYPAGERLASAKHNWPPLMRGLGA